MTSHSKVYPGVGHGLFAWRGVANAGYVGGYLDFVGSWTHEYADPPVTMPRARRLHVDVVVNRFEELKERVPVHERCHLNQMAPHRGRSATRDMGKWPLSMRHARQPPFNEFWRMVHHAYNRRPGVFANTIRADELPYDVAVWRDLNCSASIRLGKQSVAVW